jgi:hypothetical protein
LDEFTPSNTLAWSASRTGYVICVKSLTPLPHVACPMGLCSPQHSVVGMRDHM